MKIKIIFMLAVLVVLAVSVALSPVNMVSETEAQNKSDRQKKSEKITDKSSKGTGEDKNVTQTRSKNSPNKTEKTNPKGGGQRTCSIDLVNKTQWVIDIYIDGKYRGTMDEYASNFTTTGSGATRLYARAEFDNGEYIYWGPREITCGSNSKDGYYEWTLTN